MFSFLTKTTEAEWKPLVEEGIKTDGIYVKVFRYDEDKKIAKFYVKV